MKHNYKLYLFLIILLFNYTKPSPRLNPYDLVKFDIEVFSNITICYMFKKIISKAIDDNLHITISVNEKPKILLTKPEIIDILECSILTLGYYLLYNLCKNTSLNSLKNFYKAIYSCFLMSLPMRFLRLGLIEG